MANIELAGIQDDGTFTTRAATAAQAAVQTALDGKASTTQAVPIGGTAGQVLAKNTATDNDVVWSTPTDATALIDAIEPIANWKSGNVSVFGSRTLTSLKNEARRLNLNTITIPVNINATSATDSNPTLDTTQFEQNKPLIAGMIDAGYNVIIEPFPYIADGTVLETDWNPSDKAAWFTAWGNHLQTIGTYGESVGAQAMYVASNLVHMESDTASWTTTIDNVRTVFTGRVFYRTNFWRTATWDQATIDAYNTKLNNALFGLVDVIAIAAYFELTDAATPSKEDLKAAIRSVPLYDRGQDIYAEIKAFHTKWNKPVFFGELGIAPYTGLAAQPWDNDPTGRTLWEPMQTNWFNAWYETFGADDWFLGYSIFCIADGTSNYELINREAEKPVRAQTFDGEVVIAPQTPVAVHTPFIVRYVGGAWQHTTLESAKGSGLDPAQTVWFIGPTGTPAPTWARTDDMWTEV